MKVLKRILFLCLLATLAACTEDAFIPESEIIPSGDGNIVDLISMVVPDIEMDATTRSKLIDDGSQLKFEWQENDAIGVVPLTGRPLSFPIHAENAGKNTALFDGGGWALKSDGKYAAFFPIDPKNQASDIQHIKIDYTGQTQGNYTDYDFLATGAVQPSNGQVTFTMTRLSAILKITIAMPAGSVARYGTLIAPTEVFGVKGTLDLSGTNPVYTSDGMTKFINTDMGFDETSSSDWNYTVYLMIPPTTLSGQTLTFRLTSDAGYAYETEFEGKNFEAGKAYQLTGTATGAVIRNLNLLMAAQNAANNPDVGSFQMNTDGSVNVNDNLDKIAKVLNIIIKEEEDPTICDEIGYFRNLEKLSCYNKKVTPGYQKIHSLDVSNNPKLTYLACENNQLTTLDLSKNTLLEELSCNANYLTLLDVSNNPKLTNLTCGENQLTTLDVSKNTLLVRLSCNTNSLTSLDVSNSPLLEALTCYNNQLSSLDISTNTNLKQLFCYRNQLTSLDLSSCTALEKLHCNGNQLTSLDTSNNVNLISLICYSNQLTSLDISSCTALESLICYYNKLTSLDISNNTNLLSLQCEYNQLTSLNVTNNTLLETLTCGGNQLTSLDVSSCPGLIDLHCYKNQLTSVDVSHLAYLEDLYCEFNQITSLDVSNNAALIYLYCDNNKLTTLDVSNNTNLMELMCDNNLFEDFTITGMEKLVYLSITNCSALKTLKCQSNHLSTLYVTDNPALKTLWCMGNYLQNLDLSGCTALTQIRSFHNMMSYLDISGCTSLYLYDSTAQSICMVGNQYVDENRDSYQEMTLKARADDTSSLRTGEAFNNDHVTVVR